MIVSWNSASYLADCLQSLAALDRPPAEIVVVDGGSSDGSAALVRERFADVELVALEENVGFCAANNLGFARTRSPYVLALNPDTRLEPGFLEALLPAFADPRVGIACGKLLRFDGATIDSAGQQLGRSRQPIDRGYGEADRGQFDREEEVFGACGAAALYRREMLDALRDPDGGYFDEAFFAFFEDLDLAWRARRAGWIARYLPDALGYHARGGSAERRGWLARRLAIFSRRPEVQLHIVRNRWLTILRNDTVADYLRNLLFVLPREGASLLLLFARPALWPRLWRERALFARALARRRLDARRSAPQVGS